MSCQSSSKIDQKYRPAAPGLGYSVDHAILSPQAIREVVFYTARFFEEFDIDFFKFLREFCVTLWGIVVLFGAFEAMGVGITA